MNVGFAKEVGFIKFFLRKLKWKLLSPTDITLMNGQKFPLPRFSDFASDVFVTEGNVDWNAEYILYKYIKEVKKGGLFVDVGANIGYYSALLKKAVDKVYAFEPDSRNWITIKELDSKGKIELIKSPVADKTQKVSLKRESSSDISYIDLEASDGDLESVSLDEYFLEKKGNVSAVKIDIEGFDILALEGAKDLIKRDQPLFLVEYNQEKGKPNSFKRLDVFLKGVNYEMFTISRILKGGKWYYSFEKITCQKLDSIKYKMLFLVPKSSMNWFNRLAELYVDYGDKGISKKTVNSLLDLKL